MPAVQSIDRTAPTPTRRLPRFRPFSPKIPFFRPAADKRHGLLARRMADILEIVRMNIKAGGRAALIIAAGFGVWCASPVRAAEEADGVAVSQGEAAPGA